MNLSIYQQSAKKKINDELNRFFAAKKIHYQINDAPKKDVIDTLHQFSLKGKHIRGMLVLASYEAYSKIDKNNIINIAAAVDLAQSSLLIHDDVMDRDEMRRGEASVWGAYKSLYKELGETLSEKVAADVAICVGDIGFFLTFELFFETSTRPHFREAFELFCREMTLVGMGQLRDVESAHLDKLSLKNIDDIYRFKTARYTFSMPLMLGAMMAGTDKSQLKLLEEFGEVVGQIFQLTDDRLSLFGATEKTGKPVGHDIAENKNTYYKYYLFQQANDEDRKILDKLFGSRTLTVDQINIVRNMLKKYEIDMFIQKKIDDQQEKALKILKELEVKKEFKELLQELVQYVTYREG